MILLALVLGIAVVAFALGFFLGRGSVGKLIEVRSPAGQAAHSALPAPVLDDDAFTAQLLLELAAGHKIEAIKLYRERSGVGLKEARDAVEALERGS